MGKAMIVITFLALWGLTCALPIADTRVNITIKFPSVVVPAQTFVTNRSREQVFTDVARIMKEANKSPFRYGKRSAQSEMSAGSILDFPRRNYRDDSEAYSRFSAPMFDALKYRAPYNNEVEKPNNGVSYPGSFPNFLEALMFRERLRQMDRLFKWEESIPEVSADSIQKSANPKLEKLARIVEVMENTQNKKPMHLFNTFYRTSTLTRARPGKRDTSSPMMPGVPEEFYGPVVFSGPMGKKIADANTGQTTVTAKNSEAAGGSF